jgi:hypothetical protein
MFFPTIRTPVPKEVMQVIETMSLRISVAFLFMIPERRLNFTKWKQILENSA